MYNIYGIFILCVCIYSVMELFNFSVTLLFTHFSSVGDGCSYYEDNSVKYLLVAHLNVDEEGRKSQGAFKNCFNCVKMGNNNNDEE